MSGMTSRFLAWTTGLVEVPLDKMRKAKGRTDNRIWETDTEFTFGHIKLENLWNSNVFDMVLYTGPLSVMIIMNVFYL